MKRRLSLTLLVLLILALPAPLTQAAPSPAGRIIRDSYGVPHIYAKSLYDLFHANGYVVAQDRLTQLELYRRAASGRLAELLGSSMLETDIETRRATYTRAERDALYAGLTAEQKLMLEAYRDGVNARIAEVKADSTLMPWDLTLQGITPATLQDWTLDNSMAVLVFMSRAFGEFGGAGGGELTNQRLYQYLGDKYGDAGGAAIFNDVVPIEDPGAPTTIHEAFGAATAAARVTHSPLEIDTGLLASVAAREARVREALESINVPVKLGSFWWAVMGRRSTTGRAMLFGGPQMGYMTPNVGYDVALHGAGFNVRGLSFAGAPGVLIGHNGRVAWSITSGFGDQVDVYIETLDPADPSRYLWQGAWQTMEQRTETFQVKGGAPVTLTVFRTVHGPVLAVDEDTHTALSERRSHWGQETVVWDVILRIDGLTSAATGIETAAALPLSFNLLFADQDGHIAYRQGGRQPVRPQGFDPRLPFPGAGEAEWQGFRAANAMPHVVDPPEGALGNWNNKPMPGWHNGDAVNWGSVDRVQRILTLLAGSAKMSPDTVKSIAPDIGRNDYRADALLPYLLDALSTPGISDDARLAEARQILAGWNHRGDEGETGEAIFSAWRTQVFDDVFRDELGDFVVPLQDFANPAGDSLLLRALQGAGAVLPVKHDYFDGIAPAKVLVDSLSRALTSLTASNGTPDMSQWPFDPGTIDFTIGATTFASIPWYSRGSYMQYLELTRPWARGENIVAPGESGAILPDSEGYPELDPHFLDQVELARNWQYKPMPLYYLPARQYLPVLLRQN